MGTKIRVRRDIMAMNGYNVLAVTGFAHQTIQIDDDGMVLVELQKTLTAGEKTTLQTNITAKVANYKEV